MRFWWVNHKATHREEIEGGFVWAPTLDKRGKPRHSWETLRAARPGDVVFSYAHARLQAVGTVTAPFRHAPQPATLGAVGSQWADDGYLVPVAWVRLAKPVREVQILFATTDNNLQREDPRQRSLDGVKSVAEEQRPVRAVS